MEMLQATRMSRSLKALCDVNRIRILEILVRGEFCVSELVEQLAIDQPKVSHHLAILRSAGIIKSRRDGRHINYSIRPTVHRRVDGEDESTDVFDLGDLTVTFRFGGVRHGAENGNGRTTTETNGTSDNVLANGLSRTSEVDAGH